MDRLVLVIWVSFAFICVLSDFSWCIGLEEGFNLEMAVIEEIESSGNPLAFNERSKARGLYQITPICLEEYNNFKGTSYNVDDLFDSHINETIASWYILERIPQMLRHFGFEVTISNVLWAYNAGIGRVVKGFMPNETVNYIKKYKEMV